MVIMIMLVIMVIMIVLVIMIMIMVFMFMFMLILIVMMMVVVSLVLVALVVTTRVVGMMVAIMFPLVVVGGGCGRGECSGAKPKQGSGGEANYGCAKHRSFPFAEC